MSIKKLIQLIEMHLIGSAHYNPDEGARKFPSTVRRLVEGDFDNAEIFDIWEGGCSQFFQLVMPDNTHILTGDRRIFPVDLENIKRPIGPADVEDTRNMYPVLRSFWQWLVKNKLDEQVDIDHGVEKSPWPIVIRFNKELKERTGLTDDNIFDMNYEAESNGETVIYDRADLPYYQFEYYTSAVPALEFLEDIRQDINFGRTPGRLIRFPEAAYDGRLAVKVQKAEEKFSDIIDSGKYDRLPKQWARAVKSLVDFSDPIVMHEEEYWQGDGAIYFNGSDSIDILFKDGLKVRGMRDATWPLIQKAQDSPKLLWHDLTDFLNGEKNKKTTC